MVDMVTDLGGRPSVVPDEVKTEILRLAAERPELKATAIAKAVTAAGSRTHTKKPIKRHHVRAILEMKPPAEERAPPSVPAGGVETAATTPAETTSVSVSIDPPEFDQHMRALPGSPLSNGTQVRREVAIDAAWVAVLKSRELMDTAGEDDHLPTRVLQFLASLRHYDSLLTSAERAEHLHARVVQQLFIINPPSGSGSSPTPGGASVPALFVQVSEQYIIELGGTRAELMRRIEGEQDESSSSSS